MSPPPHDWDNRAARPLPILVHAFSVACERLGPLVSPGELQYWFVVRSKIDLPTLALAAWGRPSIGDPLGMEASDMHRQ